MNEAPDIKKTSSKRRAEMGFERSVPRCETCRAFKKPQVYLTKNSITGATEPFCQVGKFSVKRTDCCDRWVHKSTGERIAAAAIGESDEHANRS
ncbi:hypothetical protein HFK83_03045 [Ralstonia pseudosolanacearum]|uniref:hypothetical protein n=1 Tax=Ralstonia solanacearum species complex TaxID=3116862 RepID=UPI0011464F0C|nr:hypothetical protein [Ralstonia pseudosolanacearum]MCK4121348.1 hypothetical protein [Ralstonia pseudosolanacearum]